MHNRLRIGLTALVVTALAGLACSNLSFLSSGDGDGSDTSVPPTEVIPTRQTVSGPASLDLDAAASFQEIPGDYSITLDFRFAGTGEAGEAIHGQVHIQGLHQDQPPGTDLRYTALGAANFDGVDEMQFVELGSQEYFVNPAIGCLTLPASGESSALTSVVDTGSFLSGTVARVPLDADVNGIPSYAFAISAENLDSSEVSSLEIGDVSGTLYVAQDGGFVTRLLLEGTGASEILSGSPDLIGDIFYQLDFIPLDGPVSVKVPDACTSKDEGGALQSDYPVMPDATGIAAFQGFLTYRVNSDLATVTDFYKTEMDAMGWTLTDDLSTEGTSILGFNQGDRNVSIVITEDANTGEISVVLAEE